MILSFFDELNRINVIIPFIHAEIDLQHLLKYDIYSENKNPRLKDKGFSNLVKIVMN
jgi:hypothetical protein